MTSDAIDLFTPIARTSDPSTSHDGAKRIEPKRGSRASEVLALIRAHPRGLTAQEVERALAHRDPKTGGWIGGYWKRTSDLLYAGMIRPTGEVRDGARVLVAVEV